MTDPAPTRADATSAMQNLASVPPYAIGSATMPGLAKGAEEAGELIQVIGKLMAYPSGEHPDGAGNLMDRLVDELGDLAATIDYIGEANQIGDLIARRRRHKLSRFRGWHEQEVHHGH